MGQTNKEREESKVKPLRKFDDQAAIEDIVNQGNDLTPTQIIGMMIARMHEHYNEEHKRFVRQLHNLRNDPIFLTRICENQLKSKFNPNTNEFEIVVKHELEV